MVKLAFDTMLSFPPKGNVQGMLLPVIIEGEVGDGRSRGVGEEGRERNAS